MIEWGIWCLGVDEVSTGFLEHIYHPEADSWVGLRDSECWCDGFSNNFEESDFYRGFDAFMGQSWEGETW